MSVSVSVGMSRQTVFIMRCFALIIVFLDVVNLERYPNYSSWGPNNIRTYLKRHGLYDALTNAYSTNVGILEVSYGPNKVDPACRLADRVVDWKPTHVKWRAKRNVYYTLMFLGVDVPTLENFELRAWLHWAVVNIFENDMSTGEEVAPYKGIGRDYQPGIHRLVFLLYRQPGRSKINFNKSWLARGNRQKFHHRPFAWKYKLWYPIAVNFFYCRSI